MNGKQKKEMRRRQSTRQLMGIDRLTGHGAKTPRGELVFFLIRSDNLSVLSNEVIRGRVRALMELLRGTDSVRLLALDSRESFQRNKLWYQERREKDDNPAIRELLRQDAAHLDTIQTTTASAREFLFAYELERQGGENLDARLTQMEKGIRDRGFHVRLAGEQDVTTEYFENFDGETAVIENGI